MSFRAHKNETFVDILKQFIQTQNAEQQKAHLIVVFILLLVLFEIIERLCQWQIGAVQLK